MRGGVAIRSPRSLGGGDHSTDEDDEHCGKDDSCDGHENRRQPGSSEISSHVEAKSFAGTVVITDLAVSSEPGRRHKSSTPMQNVLLLGATVFLALMFWLRRKPIKPMLSSTDASAVAQLNRAQLELVIEPQLPDAADDDPLRNWRPPSTVQERVGLQQQLVAAMNAGPDERLQAVQIAARWGHRSVLPLLRRALRDSDSRVITAAASAIEPYRSMPKQNPAQAGRPPRNVSRMR